MWVVKSTHDMHSLSCPRFIKHREMKILHVKCLHRLQWTESNHRSVSVTDVWSDILRLAKICVRTE
uniref:SJCHGC05880 protein n=1 Tax=Schistosoma japonicum TaxID=6182 RepID=Q5BS65_SCHJA|nr:SJCHGC05880 protein [Schistosoma japonicum]